MPNSPAFELGDIVRVSGEMGTFKIIKFYKNGDVGCWGGLGGHLPVKDSTGHVQFRAFKPVRLRKAKVRNLRKASE